MSFCPLHLTFSTAHSQSRVEKASQTLGHAVVKRILVFALFLMGARRQDIARHLSIPLGTLFSLLTRIGQQGLPAMEDRRRRSSDFLPPQARERPALKLTSNPSEMVLNFGREGPTIRIPTHNPLQVKTFLLTLLQNGLLTGSQVAHLLGYSPAHTARMARRLAESDVFALLDKRVGQKKDYRVSAQVKAELIQQFALDVITGRRASGEAIAAQLQDRCQISVAALTVRQHLAELGLSKIRSSLPQLVAAAKKTP